MIRIALTEITVCPQITPITVMKKKAVDRRRKEKYSHIRHKIHIIIFVLLVLFVAI